MGLQILDPRFKSGCRLQSTLVRVFRLGKLRLARQFLKCIIQSRGGGMVDAKDLKSFGIFPVPVRVRPSASVYTYPGLSTRQAMPDAIFSLNDITKIFGIDMFDPFFFYTFMYYVCVLQSITTPEKTILAARVI